MVGSEGFEPP